MPRGRVRGYSYSPNTGDSAVYIPERALWWLVKMMEVRHLVESGFDFLGLLWVCVPVLDFCLPKTLVVCCMKLFVTFIVYLTKLEEELPFFLLFEYLTPVCLAGWFALSTALYGTPTCCSIFISILSFFTSSAGWLLSCLCSRLYQAEEESRLEFGLQLLSLIPSSILLFMNQDRAGRPDLTSPEVALVKEFGGCSCPARTEDLSKLSFSRWSLHSQATQDFLEVITSFQLIRAGLDFDEVPTEFRMKVITFIERELEAGRGVFTFRYPSCTEDKQNPCHKEILDSGCVGCQSHGLDVTMEKTGGGIFLKIGAAQQPDTLTWRKRYSEDFNLRAFFRTLDEADRKLTRNLSVTSAIETCSSNTNFNYKEPTLKSNNCANCSTGSLNSAATKAIAEWINNGWKGSNGTADYEEWGEKVRDTFDLETKIKNMIKNQLAEEEPVEEEEEEKKAIPVENTGEGSTMTTQVQSKTKEAEGEEKANEEDPINKTMVTEREETTKGIATILARQFLLEEIKNNSTTKSVEEEMKTTKGEPDKKVCGRPGCQDKGLQLCSRCLSISYCGHGCSETHWPEHRSACSKEKERRERRRRRRAVKLETASEVD